MAAGIRMATAKASVGTAVPKRELLSLNPAVAPSEKLYSRLGNDLRPRSLGKYRAILAAASRTFITQGFERTSMDVVAEAAGVSKRTVYGHFDSKHALFVAVIETLCAKILPPSLDDASLEVASVDQILTTIGRQFLTGIYSAEQVELLRTVITDAARFPELGEIMYDGPIIHSERVLASYFERMTASGFLKIAKPELGAAQFMGMLKTNLHVRLLLKPEARVTPKEINAIVTSCVDLFLHGAMTR